MKSKLLPLLILLIIIIAVAAGYWYFSNNPEELQQVLVDFGLEDIEALQTEDQKEELPLTASGFIEAHEVPVASETGGRIEHLAVDKGDEVMEGQPVVQLETSLLGAQKEQIETGRLQIIAMSDHGQITLSGERLDLAAKLSDAGFNDCTIVAANAGGIWVKDHDPKLITDITIWLQGQDWCGPLFTRDGAAGTLTHEQVAIAHRRAPDIALVMAWTGENNEWGLPGTSLHDAPYPTGGGCHGGLPVRPSRSLHPNCACMRAQSWPFARTRRGHGSSQTGCTRRACALPCISLIGAGLRDCGAWRRLRSAGAIRASDAASSLAPHAVSLVPSGRLRFPTAYRRC